MAKRITTRTDLTIGIDVGDRSSEMCVLGGDGEVVRRERVATSVGGLERHLGKLSRSRVVIEVGTHSPWMSRWLEEQGHEVLVANPREVTSIAKSRRKNDRRDAEQLARLGRADPALLCPVQHRGEQVQRDRALLAVRDQLVRMRGSLASKTRSLTKSLGERLPKGEPPALPRRVKEAGLEGLFEGMDALLATIEALNEQIRRLDARIEDCAKQRYPETVLLRQVQGVGPITSLAYVLTLEDPSRFARSRTVGSYVGLRPMQRESGERRPMLSISKEGDRFLRRLLVQSAQYILGAFGPDCDLRRFGQRLAKRGGRAAKKKAVVAVARKLAVLLHRLWRAGEVYDPLYLARRSSAPASA